MPTGNPSPDADTIRRTAAEILTGPDFHLDRGAGDREPSLLMELLFRLLGAIADTFRFLQGLPLVLRFVIAAVLVGILAFLVWQMVATILSFCGVRRPALRGERVRTQAVRPEDLELAADTAARAGELLTAVRHLFRAALRRIEIAAATPWPRGLTDREVLARTARSPLHAPLSGFVDTLELAWYGDRPCGPADLDSCRQHHGRIVQMLASGAKAVGPLEARRADGRFASAPPGSLPRTETSVDALSS